MPTYDLFFEDSYNDGRGMVAILKRDGKSLESFTYDPAVASVSIQVTDCLHCFIGEVIRQYSFSEALDMFASESDYLSFKRRIENAFEKYGKRFPDVMKDATDDPEDVLDLKDDDYGLYFDAILENQCAFAEYHIGKFLQCAWRGKGEIDSADAPKGIEFLIDDGRIMFAQISSIKVLPVKKEFMLEYLSAESITVAFKRNNSSYIVALLLNESRVIPSNSEKNWVFLRPDNITKYYGLDYRGVILVDTDYCSKEYRINSDMLDFAGNLTPALNYYNKCLNTLNSSVRPKVTVSLDLCRDYYNFFDSLIPDDGLFILPVFDKSAHFDGVTILGEDENGEKFQMNYPDVRVQEIDSAELNQYIRDMQDNGIELFQNDAFCILNTTDLANPNDRFEIIRLLNDSRIVSLEIAFNIEGERTRLTRIIRGIENVLKGYVASKPLVGIVCNGKYADDIISENRLRPYLPDEKFIQYIRDTYPILRDNKEQIAAIDKIVQMDKHGTEFVLVQGPPGTGKTEMILTLAKELTKQGKKTLITSNVHVACENVVERLRGDKELLLKRYTTVKGPQYEKELIRNQRLYVENQVLAGFESGNDPITNLDEYHLKAQQLAELQGKKSLLSSILGELSNSSKLHTREAEIKAQRDSLTAAQSKAMHSMEVQESQLSSLGLEIASVEQVYESANQSFRSHVSRQKALESLIGPLGQEIAALQQEISTLEKNNSASAISPETLQELTPSRLASVAKSHYIDGVPFPNELYSRILSGRTAKIELLAELFHRLQSDKEFWEGTADASDTTIEYLYFATRGNVFFSEILSDNSIRAIEELYNYQVAAARSKKSFFSFGTWNAGNQANVAAFNDTLNRELKQIKYSIDDYVRKALSTALPDSDLSDIVHTLSVRMENNVGKISQLKDKLEEKKTSLMRYSEENATVSRDIALAARSVSEAKAPLVELKQKQSTTELALHEAKAELDSLTEQEQALDMQQRQILHARLQALLEHKGRFSCDSPTMQEFHSALISNLKKSAPEERLAIVTSVMTSTCLEMQAVDAALRQIDDRIAFLELNGWTRDTAISFIFDYIDELHEITTCDETSLASHLQGRGASFSELFKLTNNDKGTLISMTTSQVASLFQADENLQFDYAIIDEASKCRFEDLIISLPKVKHLVLIGDFMQLDPIYKSFSELSTSYQSSFTDIRQWDELNRSTFSTLLSQQLLRNDEDGIEGFDSNPCVAVLKRQYRMNRGIFDIIAPVYQIHKGFELIDEKNTSSRDVMCVAINGEERVPRDETSKSKVNDSEADAIVSVLKALHQNRAQYPEIKTIGVITGYRRQVRLIRDGLKSERISGLQVGTFDRFQGREYDLVLVSLVRTKGLGFNDNIRRMNVAFSRAKQRLLVFGNFDALLALAGDKSNSKMEYDTKDPSQKAEFAFVRKTLIPKLYGLREEFLSEAEMLSHVMGFIKE